MVKAGDLWFLQMVTVHRLPAVNDMDEVIELADDWQGYIEAAEEHAANLDHYEEAAGMGSESP